MTIQQKIGRRLRAAQEDSGLSAAEIQRQLGYTGSATLHRWFTGEQRPAYEDIAAFGALTGKPFSWFFAVDEESEDQAAFMVDALTAVLYRMLSGEDPGDALVGELGDPAILPPGVRRLLSDSTEAAREELVAMTNGWLDLAPAERRSRLRRIVLGYLDPEAL